jgi:hypothetical protein
VFCSVGCRHLGELPPDQRRPVDKGAVERLFDPARDPNERVRGDDWFPGNPSPAVRELYAVDTVWARRQWYTNLLRRR